MQVWLRCGVAISCDNSAAIIDAPSAELRTVTIDLPAMYRARLADPQSLGNRHNAGLAEVLASIKSERIRVGGRKLRKSEICRIVAQVGAKYMPLEEAQLVASNPESTRRIPCKRSLLADRASERAQEVQRAQQAQPAMARTMDMIDSVWADDSYWDDPDSTPTFDDDLLFVASWQTTVTSAVENATSVAGVSSALTSALGSANISDSVQAVAAAEMASLAYSSVSYWNENYQEWIEQYCPVEEDSLGEPVLPTTEPDPCNPYASEAAIASIVGTRDFFGFVKDFAMNDVEGMFGIVEDLVEGYKNVKANWASVGRSLPGGQTFVRGLAGVTTRHMVVQGAKLAARTTLPSSVGIALIESSIGMAR